MNVTNIIGVLISDIMNPFFAEVVKGIQIAAKKANFMVILTDTNDSIDQEKFHIEKMCSTQVDGIILCSTFIEGDVIEMIESKNIPYVLLSRGADKSMASCVLADDENGMYVMVKYLLGIGHKKIAHLSGPLYADTAIRRLTGFRRAMKEAGVSINPGYVLETKYDETSGYEGCKLLLANEDRPTAICAANDLSAIGAIRAINEAGLSIPSDISITGFDNVWVASKVYPSLTTIKMPLCDMGMEAFNMLIQVINSKGKIQENKKYMFPTELVVRNSTGIPKAR
jgi:DNA-binding LacI/PurR family transcriptional regulator